MAQNTRDSIDLVVSCPDKTVASNEHSCVSHHSCHLIFMDEFKSICTQSRHSKYYHVLLWKQACTQLLLTKAPNLCVCWKDGISKHPKIVISTEKRPLGILPFKGRYYMTGRHNPLTVEILTPHFIGNAQSNKWQDRWPCVGSEEFDWLGNQYSNRNPASRSMSLSRRRYVMFILVHAVHNGCSLLGLLNA